MKPTVHRRPIAISARVRPALGLVLLCVLSMAGHASPAAADEPAVYTKAELAAIVQLQRTTLTALTVSWTETDSSVDFGTSMADGMFAFDGPEHWRDSLRVSPEPDSLAASGLRDCIACGDWSVFYSSRRGWAVAAPSAAMGQYSLIDIPGSRYLRFLMFWPAGSSTDTTARDLVSLLAAPQSALRDSVELIQGTPCHVLDIAGPDGEVFGSIWIAAEQGGIPRRQLWNPDASMSFDVEAVAEVGGVFLPTRCIARFPAGGCVTLAVALDAHGAPLISLQPTLIDLPENPMDIVPSGASVSDVVSGTTSIARVGDVRGRAREVIAAAGIAVPFVASRASVIPRDRGELLLSAGVWALGLTIGWVGVIAARTRRAAAPPCK